MAGTSIEYMLSAEIVLVIHSVIGFLLNGFTLAVAGLGLKFKSPDLILIGIIAFLDGIFYTMSITRISLLWFYKHKYQLLPTWWCKFDSALLFTATQSTIEIVAILGLMRYLVICHNVRLPTKVWMMIVFCSATLSLATTLVNDTFKNAYMWSKSGLLCLPFALPGMPSRNYFVGWLSLLVARFFISLVIISYCYYKILVSFRQSVRAIPDSSEESKNESSNENLIRMGDVRAKQQVDSLDTLSLEDQVKRKAVDSAKIRTTFKLISVILAYIICIVPDIVISLLIIAGYYNIPKEAFAATHFLVATAGYVSPIFTLLAHEPTNRYLTTLYVRYTTIIFRIDSNSTRLNATFPYQVYN